MKSEPNQPNPKNAQVFEQTVQAWGNGLGLRFTGPAAKAAHLSRGVVVTMEIVEDGVLIRPIGERKKLTLAQKLERYDPEIHGGGPLVQGRAGGEIF
ncbi:AbrB/MazE/SpoVT family DNA-binding domain-containing protein [Variovorax sp. RHLX14]|uniref:AbrB/MazE/SpoVT family DNA-binding domain-containing protein n=1 Tax=Variovorax sp. RHLX14 TaxID=1259731 RepID=UPI003F4590AF